MRINELLEVLTEEQKVSIVLNSSIVFEGEIKDIQNNNLIKALEIKNIKDGTFPQSKMVGRTSHVTDINCLIITV